ncbi:hypothetical protein G9A89_011674 [Geosiphon pyriformis]|nr:hypothetical protein G9A89_011674 [Geosiphon pyriformis]
MGEKVGWIYDLLGDVKYLLGAVITRNQEIRVDFSQVAGRDQARKILANNEIESFLMATDGVNIQMAEMRAAMKEFGEVNKIQIRVAGKWQSTVVEYNNQEEATKAVDQWLTIVRKNAVRIYPMIGTQKIIEQRKTWEAKLVGCAYIGFDSEASCNNATKKPLVIGNTLVHWVPTDAKECYFCYQVGHLVSKCPTLHKKKEGNTKKVTNNIRLAKLYVKRNVLEENIKAFGGRSYADMAKPGPQVNNREEQSKKEVNQSWKSEIDELQQQVNKMAKLLNAVAAKLGVTIEKVAGAVLQLENLNLWKQMMCSTPNSNIEQNYSNNDTWKIGTVNVRGLNNPGKTEEVLHWVIEEQFDFVIVTETKMTLTKEKGVFFGSDKYYAFWESSTEKQIETGVNILVKKCWIHHVETIKGFHGRLLHLGLKFRGRVSVHIVGLYMPVSKVPTEGAVTKEIRKLLGDIVQNKEIIIVAGNLNEDLSSKSLEEAYAANKAKACPTAATLQHMNLVDTHGTYPTNNPEKTWASNGVQKRLDYVFTDAVTASLVTNIGVIDVNESFSTDHKAVITIIRSNRILAGTKKSRSGRKKCSTTMINVKKASGVQ